MDFRQGLPLVAVPRVALVLFGAAEVDHAALALAAVAAHHVAACQVDS